MEEHEQIVAEEPATETAILIQDDIAAVRAVVLRAHPDVVPELIAGATVAELLASVEPARAAFARVVATASPGEEAASVKTVAPAVPAGDAPAFAVDPNQLPPVEKIRRGLAGRRG